MGGNASITIEKLIEVYLSSGGETPVKKNTQPSGQQLNKQKQLNFPQIQMHLHQTAQCLIIHIIIDI